MEEKRMLLEKSGIDHLIIHPFDAAFSKLSAEAFVQKVLVDQLKIHKIIIYFEEIILSKIKKMLLHYMEKDTNYLEEVNFRRCFSFIYAIYLYFLLLYSPFHTSSFFSIYS
jgi:hypothetical protein